MHAIDKGRNAATTWRRDSLTHAVDRPLLAMISLLVLGGLLLAGLEWCTHASTGIVSRHRWWMETTTGSDNNELVPQIHAANIKAHLEELQRIAYAHPSHSRSIVNAYNASAEYIMQTLQTHTDCVLSTQPFKVPVWADDSGDAEMRLLGGRGGVQLQPNYDFRVMREGGVATNLSHVTVRYVDNGGCADSDYVGDYDFSGVAVLLDAQTAVTKCGYWAAAYRAQLMGASAVLFQNAITARALSNSRVRPTGWKEGDPLMQIPVLSVSHSLGQFFQLQQPVPAEIQLITHSTLTIATTFNVICDTREGNPDDIVMIGAHLDSVPAGPGMVDDGTGTAAILEVFLQLYKTGMNKRLVNKLRFAWFGAEEIGLMGSRHYCRELVKQPDEASKIIFYSNHDMLGAPNYVPFIHDGATAPAQIRNQSLHITGLYADYFNQLPVGDKFSGKYSLDPMTGGSDYFSFLEIGIPAGGLATGAGSLKTMAERTKFGGLANAPYDPCYHQSCDTVENVNFDVLQTLARSLAHLLEQVGYRQQLRQWISTAA